MSIAGAWDIGFETSHLLSTHLPPRLSLNNLWSNRISAASKRHLERIFQVAHPHDVISSKIQIIIEAKQIEFIKFRSWSHDQ